jgi:hypothetical protein
VGPTLPHVIFLCGCRSGIATLGCMYISAHKYMDYTNHIFFLPVKSLL